MIPNSRIAIVPLFKDRPRAARVPFRPRDKWSLGDRRECLRLAPGEEAAFHFQAGAVPPGTAEVRLEASLEIHGSHAYVHKHLNTAFELRINGTPVFDGVHHWRSHEETASFWTPFDFPFDAALLKKGRNTLTFRNRTSFEVLGDFLDPALAAEFGPREALRQLGVHYLSAISIGYAGPRPVLPALSGTPRTALAGQPFIVEAALADASLPVVPVALSNAAVEPLGAEHEFGAWRHLFAVTALEAGRPCRFAFDAGGVRLEGRVPRVFPDRKAEPLAIGPGMECVYRHRLERIATDFFARETGNVLRISIDGYLNDLHHLPPEEWRPLVRYLVRRRRRYAFQRIRVPPYSRISPADLKALADLGGSALFAGTSVVEPVLGLKAPGPGETLRTSLERYLELFRARMAEARLPGHRLVTFDSCGPLCGHYYAAGLDAHITELGPACNCLEEACCRGASAAAGKPWGVAVAMQWYAGQGAQYAHDAARVRYAQLAMHSALLAGARSIVWEGGAFQNLPVYNFILSPESWRDFGRRYDGPSSVAVRACFGKTLDFHREHQLPAPRVRFGVVRGVNDLFHGRFTADTSALLDLSLARAWTLLKIWLPHVSWGRGATDHGRPHRRWYSWTPYGQVDVVPAEAGSEALRRYGLLALLSWNTMTEALYGKLLRYVRGGGTLFLALPHLVRDEKQELEWSFFRDGRLEALAGVRVRGLGGRLEEVRFRTGAFRRHLPRRMVLSEKNPLFPEDFDELYPVFGHDVTYFTGEVRPAAGTEVLAESQSGEPVLLKKRIGRGAVYLLNTYHHPGRGRLLDLAEGILRTLVEAQPAPLRMEDPSERVAWFEYPDGRFCFLNTDWTRPAAAEITVTAGGRKHRLRVRTSEPFFFHP